MSSSSIPHRLGRGQVRTKRLSPAIYMVSLPPLWTLGKSLLSWGLFSHKAWQRVHIHTSSYLKNPLPPSALPAGPQDQLQDGKATKTGDL
jgi:hypothetical protein